MSSWTDPNFHTKPRRKNVLDKLNKPSMSTSITRPSMDVLFILLMMVMAASVMHHSVDLSKIHLVALHLVRLSVVAAVDHPTVVQAVDHLAHLSVVLLDSDQVVAQVDHL
jgi:hypothetical protein